MKASQIYKSGAVHDVLQANKYSQTHQSPHRFLAYRDFSKLIRNFGNINRVLDFGSGTGASTAYLFNNGYDAVGVDKSPAMIKEAKLNFPELQFADVAELKAMGAFDLVFSSFVLFELSTKEEIKSYLNLASLALRDEGVFIGITGSENLHQKNRTWLCFDVDYQENVHPNSGDIVKLGLIDPKMEFCDYYWKESDYRECFHNSNLEIIQIYYPLGLEDELFEWKDELSISPFVVFLAKKRK